MDFGIDFGTTNSACTGIQEKRHPFNFTDKYGTPFPSIIIIDRTDGRVFCGREAWQKREELNESCVVIPSIKTYLGTGKEFKIAGRIWTPETIAAQVFLGLKKLVEERASDLNEAVVAVPVGFPPEKRAALRNAAKMAGIMVKSFVSEPTAAVFSHYGEIGFNQKIGVFDWGGGTLDVSIIENRKGMVRELAKGGLSLAGDYIDRKLAIWVHNQILKRKDRQISFEQMSSGSRDKLISYCEQAKKDLTYDDIAEVRFWEYGELGEVNVNIDIDTFSRLISREIDDAIACFEITLTKARMSMEEIECILMVGGSINLRPLADRIHERWKDKVFYPQDSDWSVASGAALLSVDPGSYRTSQTIGVTMSDGNLYPLLTEGSIVNSSLKEFTFALVEDASSANLVFSDGNGNFLGSMNVPSFGFFKERINIRTYIDENLIFRANAKSLQRGREYSSDWSYPGITLNYQLPVEGSGWVKNE